ncbi:MAG: metallophosphoesterase family protein, partial [Candidatus Binatia bacterium]
WKSLACLITALFLLVINLVGALALDRVTFVNISDPHLALVAENTPENFKITDGSAKILRQTLSEVNQIPGLSFVVLTGDLLNDGEPWNLNAIQEMLSELTVPYYVTLGNHDYAHPGREGISKAEFIFTFQGHGFQGSKGWYSVDLAPGLHGVFLDSTVSDSHGGYIPSAELRWLDRDLNDNRDKLTLIFVHHLLVPAVSQDTTEEWEIFLVKNAQRVNALLKRYPQVRVVISGHHHLGKVKTVDGIHYLVNHSIVTYPNRYVLYELTPQQLKYRTVPISDQKIISLAREKLLDKRNLFKVPGLSQEDAVWEEKVLKLFEGSAEDNEGVLDIQKITPGGKAAGESQ